MSNDLFFEKLFDFFSPDYSNKGNIFCNFGKRIGWAMLIQCPFYITHRHSIIAPPHVLKFHLETFSVV